MREGYKRGAVKRGKVKFNGEYYGKGCKEQIFEAPADVIDRLVKNGIVDEVTAQSKPVTAPQKTKPVVQPAPSPGPVNTTDEDPADVKISLNPEDVIVNPGEKPKKGRNK